MSGAIDDTARAAICAAWRLGPNAAFEALGNGLIHRTLHVRDGQREFVLQRLNTEVFRSPGIVMRNLETITAHLARERAAGRYDFDVLHLVPTRDGAPALTHDDAGVWRLFDFVRGTHTHDVAGSTAIAFEAARAFGAFARALSTLPASAIGKTIPAFHDPAARLANFRRAVAEDRAHRLSDCLDACDAAMAVAVRVDEWRALETALPRRIVHNDCKLNNVLFDGAERAVCVIDLDTAMPGSPLFDFGDLARTIVNPEAEDSTRRERVVVREDLFGALVQGYFEGSGALLADIEREHLVFGARLVTAMLALRFLADHLDGDAYFRIERPGQNLDRARNQLALLAAFERAEPRLQAIVRAA